MVFVDTGWDKPHVCYDPVEDRFFEVKRLNELRDYEEMFLDSSVFPGMWSDLKELVESGCRLYYFTRPWKWKMLRKMFRLKKSDYNDALVIYKLYEASLVKGNVYKWFRGLSRVDTELRPLLMKENCLAKTVQRFERLSDVGVEVDEYRRSAETELIKVRREIIESGFRLMPWLRNVVDELRPNGENVEALVGLIGLVVYLRRPPSYHESLRYLGLYRARHRSRKRCNGKVRRYLMMVTRSIVGKEGGFPPRLRDQRKILRMLIKLLKEVEPVGAINRYRRGYAVVFTPPTPLTPFPFSVLVV